MYCTAYGMSNVRLPSAGQRDLLSSPPLQTDNADKVATVNTSSTHIHFTTLVKHYLHNGIL